MRLSSLLLLALLLFPHGAKAWWNDEWSYRKKITLDTGPKGAALTDDPGRMPLLLRLHDGNFDFTNVGDGGIDIRFVDSDDKTPLKYHIETYDGLLGMALVWVDVPAVKAGTTHDIWLYYGDEKAQQAADAKGTYDADTMLVYHFADRDAPPRDQTANGNNATTAANSDDASLIGRGARFDGTNAILLPPSTSLAIAAGAPFTWSAWIKSDAVPPVGVLFARHDGDRAFTIGLDQNGPYVSVTQGGNTVRSNPGTALTPAAWHHIAVTASDHITLFIDGKPGPTLASALPALGGTASLGADVDPAGTVAQGTGFIGDIDELEISKIARTPGFIAAAFATQGPEGPSVVYGADEENAGWSGGYFGVILRSVTIDGWVVIGILGIMAAVSWIVMINKALYIGAVARANRRFLEIFDRIGADAARLEAHFSKIDPDYLERSTLYRVCRAGTAEFTRRVKEDGLDSAMTPQAMDSTRASLDRVAVYEMQRLNATMVLLTIAISGGPFLGLLGTVVGVMITFAAIAATGDVNINAIAPGIAAALVATVAGLGVAIPALFGYNYLITRIKDVTTEMQVFVEEFVTKLAEPRRPGPGAEQIAAE